MARNRNRNRTNNTPTEDQVKEDQTTEKDEDESEDESDDQEDEVEEDETEDEDSDEEAEEEEDTKPATKSEKGVGFTYVGAGEESPARIKFMGKQDFVLGRYTIVTDLKLIEKLTGNPAFVKGKVKPEVVQDIQDKAAVISAANRKADKAMDAQFKKLHHGE